MPLSKKTVGSRCKQLFWGLMAATALSLATADVKAAPLNWPDKVYPYVAVEQDLTELLIALGRNMDVGIRLSKTVEGKVKGRLPQLPPEEFLNHLARTYGLVWYYDGHVLEVTTVSDVVSRVVSLKKISVKRLYVVLQALEIWDDRYPPRSAGETGIVFVSGPRRYVELVTQTAKELDNAAPKMVRLLKGSGGTMAAGDAGGGAVAGLIEGGTSLNQQSSGGLIGKPPS